MKNIEIISVGVISSSAKAGLLHPTVAWRIAVPDPSPVRPRLAGGAAALIAAASLLLVNPSPAAAVVSPLHGFQATVDGFTSWYGSYAMGSLGTAWCIDHGSRAPDPALAYAPTALGSVSADTRAAMAWVVGAHGRGTDRVGHAAVMLVLHDLMGARYPSGRLDVDRLTIGRMAGFGGLEGRVLERARLLKADGLAHRHLREPLHLSVTASPVVGRASTVTVRLHDADGRPLPGIRVQLDAPAAQLRATTGTTAADGTWRTEARLAAPPVTIHATAELPRLVLDAWAPTTRSAQRVARPGRDTLRASLPRLAPPPSTTPTTTVPPTTTTTAIVTPTTIAPTTTTTTTLPPSTTTTTTTPTTTTATPPTTGPAAAVPSTTTTAPPPPPTTLPAPPVTSLPRTGRDVTPLVLLALGCVSIGSAALDVAAGRTRCRHRHTPPRHRR